MESNYDNDEQPAAGEQALWDLLGRNRPVEVSPFFVRRVLRDLDAEASTSWNDAAAGWRAWLKPAWILGGSTAGLAVVAGVLSFASLTGRPLPAAVRRQVGPSVVLAPIASAAAPAAVALPAPAVPVGLTAPAVAAVAVNGDPSATLDLGDDVSPQDVDVIADLDNLVAREETSVWTDDTSRF
jgi:hypothetical protein